MLDFKDVERSRPIAKPERIARSYSSMGDEKGDKGGKTNQIQAGILSAVKAAVHFADVCNERQTDTSSDIFFFMPILIVDGPIFECYFGKGSSKLEAQEVYELVYMQNYLSPSYGEVQARVHVISMSLLASCVQAYEQWAENILATMKAKTNK